MEQTVTHSGAWALAIIMIVVISWFFYRYVAPKSWHEWAGAGVVQAFICCPAFLDLTDMN